LSTIFNKYFNKETFMVSALITYLILVHISSSVVSIYMHRGLGHHYFEFKPILHHIFRFWLWFTCVHAWPNWQQNYAAKHRKHHMTTDTVDDPHSPYFYTFRELIDFGHKDPKRANYITLEEQQKLAPDIQSPNDWLERNVYNKHPKLGLALYAGLLTAIFGWPGLILGLFNFFCVHALFVFFGNYLFHKVGFNYAQKGIAIAGKSKIFFPWGIFSGGEELHTHHHNDPSLPYHSRNWWEFDIGWMYIRILMFFGLMSMYTKN
jgi:stearoyl-CoA desaturase (delta-9 desaturase)